jgi:hypothetical protein
MRGSRRGSSITTAACLTRNPDRAARAFEARRALRSLAQRLPTERRREKVEIDMPPSSAINELRHRVEAKRKMLEARLEETKVGTFAARSEAARELRAKLRELDERIGDGWDTVTEEAAARLNEWLKEH